MHCASTGFENSCRLCAACLEVKGINRSISKMHVDYRLMHFVSLKRIILLFTDSQHVFNRHDGKEIEFELSKRYIKKTEG